jgi:hypothetical protein
VAAPCASCDRAHDDAATAKGAGIDLQRPGADGRARCVLDGEDAAADLRAACIGAALAPGLKTMLPTLSSAS